MKRHRFRPDTDFGPKRHRFRPRRFADDAAGGGPEYDVEGTPPPQPARRPRNTRQPGRAVLSIEEVLSPQGANETVAVGRRKHDGNDILSETDASRFICGAMGFVGFEVNDPQYESELITSVPARVESCW